MATIRSLKEVRKQYKEKALEAAQVSTGPQPSPPVSECDFYSTATDVMDEAARMKMSQKWLNQKMRKEKFIQKSFFKSLTKLILYNQTVHEGKKLDRVRKFVCIFNTSFCNASVRSVAEWLSRRRF